MIETKEFLQRRTRLLSQLDKNAVAVIPAAVELTRSRDTEFPFRQDSDFYYLTGFNEPDAVLVLCKDRDEQVSSHLFCRNKDKIAEIWHGRRVGYEQAKTQYLFDHSYPLSELDEQLQALVNTKRVLYYDRVHIATLMIKFGRY